VTDDRARTTYRRALELSMQQHSSSSSSSSGSSSGSSSSSSASKSSERAPTAPPTHQPSQLIVSRASPALNTPPARAEPYMIESMGLDRSEKAGTRSGACGGAASESAILALLFA